MKSAQFATVIQDLLDLTRTTSSNPALPALEAFERVFSQADTLTVKAALKKLEPGTYDQVGVWGGAAVGDAAAVIGAFATFGRRRLKKADADDIEALLAFVEANGKASLTSLESQAPKLLTAAKEKPAPKAKAAPKPKAAAKAKAESAPKQKASAKLNATSVIIERYYLKLDETFGFEPDFDNVFKELESDATLGLEDLKTLAKRFAQVSVTRACRQLSRVC